MKISDEVEFVITVPESYGDELAYQARARTIMMVTSRALQKPLFEIPACSLSDVHISKRGERERSGLW